jgi:hypothetical protein
MGRPKRKGIAVAVSLVNNTTRMGFIRMQMHPILIIKQKTNGKS